MTITHELLLEYLRKNGYHSPFQYNIHLFELLNKFYESRPIVSAPRKYDSESRLETAKVQMEQLAKIFPLSSPIQCLEFGCGGGDTAAFLAKNSRWDITAIDIKPRYDAWHEHGIYGNLRFINGDIEKYIVEYKNKFDLIYSFVVFEHVRNPQLILEALYSVLKDNGICFIKTNLYRSTIASHLYRDIYFPYPHLLFENSVFDEYFAKRGNPGKRPTWVNKMSQFHYLDKFRSLGFKILDAVYSGRPYDEEFVNVFHEKLGKYPNDDLKIDFMTCTLQKSRHNVCSTCTHGNQSFNFIELKL